MPVVCFSGGIDSTVLAYDVGISPYRYGVAFEEKLILLHTVPKSSRTKDGIERVAPIVEHLKRISRLPVELHVVPNALRGEVVVAATREGVKSLDPVITQYPSDLYSLPFTPGWMLWMMGIAENILYYFPERNYGFHQVFIGHQWEGPVWRLTEEGKLPLQFDASPKFYEGINSVMECSGSNVRIRVPFLENRVDKHMICSMALDLGVPLKLTSSCTLGWQERCGICNSCLKRHATLTALRIKDGD